MDRREFLLWVGSVSALATLSGCATDAAADSAPPVPPAPYAARPAAGYAPPPRVAMVPPAPVPARAPAPVRAVPYPVERPVSRTPVYGQPAAPAPAPAPAARPAALASHPPAPPLPAPVVADGRGISVISRESWKAAPPNPAKLTRMNGVSRITVHHEGNPKPNNDVGAAQVAETLRLIQQEHRSRMNAADIGYHFIIDRSGRIWQGRDEAYQGAHVSGQNANNLGILLLGNYDVQQPTAAQLASLDRLLRHVMRAYQVPKSRVYCHGELANTRCPGVNLRNQFAALRARM